MSKKSSKLMQIKEMFDTIEIDFSKLNNEGIQDRISIIKKQYIIKEKIHEIIEFYYRFIFYLEDMMEAGKKNGYNLISFMGP